MAHVMVDLETLGTTPGCVIVSIGACVFSKEGIGETFYKTIDIDTSPLRVEAGTVKWWMGQSEEARAAFKQGIPHTQALLDFSDWWWGVSGSAFWCQGSDFDAPILRAAYPKNKIPWDYWRVMDARTLCRLSGNWPDRKKGAHHNALDDARAQAEATIKSLNKFGWPAE